MTKLWSCCGSRLVTKMLSFLSAWACKLQLFANDMWYNYTSTNYAVFLCCSVLISVNNYFVF